MNNPSSNIKRTVDNGKSSHLMGLYIKDTKYYKGPLVHYMHEAILKKVEQRLEEYYGKYFLIRDGELSGYFYMVASTIKNDIINSDFGATMEQLKSAYKFLRNLDAKLYKIFPKLREVVATTTEKYVYDMVPEYRKSMTIPQAGPVAGGGTPNPLGRNSLVTAQGILSSHTTSQPTQILIPKIITTNRPVTISTTQNVLSSQIYTIERPLDVITNRRIQTPTGTYQMGQSVQPVVRYEQVKMVTPKTILSSRPATITGHRNVLIRQPANLITTQNISQATRPYRIISTSQPIITPVGTPVSRIQVPPNSFPGLSPGLSSGLSSGLSPGLSPVGFQRLNLKSYQPTPTFSTPQPLSARGFISQPPIYQSPMFQPPTIQPSTIQQSTFQSPIVQSPIFQSPLAQPLATQLSFVQPLTIQTPITQPLTVQSLGPQIANQPVSIRTVTTRTFRSI